VLTDTVKRSTLTLNQNQMETHLKHRENMQTLSQKATHSESESALFVTQQVYRCKEMGVLSLLCARSMLFYHHITAKLQTTDQSGIRDQTVTLTLLFS